MKLIWEYYPENIFRSNLPVAKMLREDGTEILRIYEARNYHYSIPYSKYSFIKVCKIYYSNELETVCLLNQIDSDFEDTSLFLQELKIACTFIQENFEEQVLNIKRALF